MKADDYLISVKLYLRGEDLDPDSVTKALGVNPSGSQRNGEKRISPTTKVEYFTKIGVWSLASDADSNSVADHITRLVSLVKVDGKALRELVGVQEAYVDIFVACTEDEDGDCTTEFDLSPSNLTDLDRMGLPVQLTVTCCDS